MLTFFPFLIPTLLVLVSFSWWWVAGVGKLGLGGLVPAMTIGGRF